MGAISFTLKVLVVLLGVQSSLWAEPLPQSDERVELSQGQRALVASKSRSGYVAGTITRLNGPNYAYFDYQVFTQNTNYFREVPLDVGIIIPSVPEIEGFQAKQIVCLKENAPFGLGGRDVEINAVFANRMAEVWVGDFFGKRFFIFKRPEIVSVDHLTNCEPN